MDKGVSFLRNCGAESVGSSCFDGALTLETPELNLFTVANLPVVVNSVDKPNICV